jgi:DNA-binding CsgD family transcriptional regulator
MLAENQGIHLSSPTVRRILLAAGISSPRRGAQPTPALLSARGPDTQERGAGNPASQLLRLLSPASPARLAVPQVRYLGRLYAAFRWAAGFGVVALLAILTPPSNHGWLALLVLWVAIYNTPTTLALSRLDNRYIGLVVRGAAIVDAISFFVLLAIYAPSTPPMLIAIYPAVLIEMVVFDGAFGGIYGVAIFVVALAGIETMQVHLNWPEVVLWGAIMTVIAASLTLSSQVLLGAGAPDVIPGQTPRPAFRAEAPRLSARELEVLRLVAAGYSNAMIASRLNLSENTIKGHVETLLTRLNARNRAEAVAAAGKLDLI